MIDMPSRFAANVPPGSILAQGDGATVDARTYVQHNTTVQVSVEQQADLLRQVGQALRPVLEQMNDRIAALEQENRLLRDTLNAVGAFHGSPVTPAALPTRVRPASAQPPYTPPAALTPFGVGTDSGHASDAASPPATIADQRPPWGQPSLLEELRYG